MTSIAIIDDDRALCRSLQLQLEGEGHLVHTAQRMQDGLVLAATRPFDLILLDINLPDQSGLTALPTMLAENPESCVVIMTGNPDNKAVIEAMRNGAYDYLRKPLDLDDLFVMIAKVEDRKKKRQPPGEAPDTVPPALPGDMIGSHPKIIALLKHIGLLSRSRVTVLIRGESGTGKELAARILHQATSPDRPFVAINCSAVVATLLESELFGYEKGAFTGAEKTKIGKMEFAGAGTVFLDEIGDMPMNLQSKLLRVLQEEEFVRVGGLEAIPLKARIVAATHRNLEEMVAAETFRQDLFYRLNVSPLHIPPLRERPQDIPQLITSLLARICTKLGCEPRTVSVPAMVKMLRHDWPGNVRELENVLTRAVALSQDDCILPDDIEWQAGLPSSADNPQQQSDGPVTLAEMERRHIEATLRRLDWNITHSAQTLAISPTTLRKKIADFNLKKPGN
ncbi:MAG: sigma-54-dependent transcriptional regulator [Thermodesulfobacteriota bacterium]